ncbi:MAG TPA: helix-turn-helix domain-containing protein [Bacteroidia bacterium]|nr:helix-turn-helix domain-containing protein [Bacteroidia bacterium]
MEVNKRIVKYLEDRGINNSVLAKKAGLSKQNLSRVLSSNDIKLSQLLSITKALELPLTYFFDGNENVTNEIESYKQKIIELENSLKDKTQLLTIHKRALNTTIEDIEKVMDEFKETDPKLYNDLTKVLTNDFLEALFYNTFEKGEELELKRKKSKSANR